MRMKCFGLVRRWATPFSWQQAVLFVLSGVLYYRAALFIHETVHLRHNSFKVFRFVWNLLCGIPFLMPSFMYYTHAEHHMRKHFGTDTDAELEAVKELVEKAGATAVVATHFANGGAGAEDLAHAVVAACEEPTEMTFTYPDDLSLWDKMVAVTSKVYGASEVTATAAVKARIQELQDSGYGSFPVCVAKTQYSFSTDAAQRGAPTGHAVNIREVRLSAGAEFVVMVCGDVMTMPGLPKIPASVHIDLVDGKVVGLS